VRDDGGVVAGCAGQLASVPSLLLHAAHNGSFRHRAQRQNVADLQGSCNIVQDIISNTVTYLAIDSYGHIIPTTGKHSISRTSFVLSFTVILTCASFVYQLLLKANKMSQA